MSENRLSIAVPENGFSSNIRGVKFSVIDGDGNTVVEGSAALEDSTYGQQVLMSTHMADKLLQVYVEKMGITPEMVQEFIDATKVKMEIMLADAGISPGQEIIDRMKKDNASFLNFPDQADADE